MEAQPKPDFSIQTDNPEKQFGLIVENLQKQVRQAHSANTSSPFHAANPGMGLIFSTSV